jgi:hypothetical protein
MFREFVVGFFALVVGLLIGAAIGIRVHHDSRESNAPPVDIAELLSNPNKFSRKLVRLTGKLDECYQWECSLCPETMTSAGADPKHCLPLEFRPLMGGTGFGERASEGVFRFSSVTLVAKFDPTCLTSPCLDRGTVLSDADVIATQQRRSSRDGLWLGAVTPLQEASAPLTAMIRSAALEAGFPAEPAMKVYNVKGDPNTAVVCWTTVGTSSWPSSLEGAIYAKSTTDFYSCNKARKAADRWVVQVQDG